jgi:hypothetical protein
MAASTDGGQPAWADEELRAVLPESAKTREKDVLGFFRELPRLIAEGEDGRVAIVHDGKVISIWDTLGDATQAAYDRFGVDGVFLTATIKAADLERLPRFLTHQRATT